MALLVCGSSTAPNTPSPAAPSPCAPSSTRLIELNGGEPLAASSRHHKVAVTPVACSSKICAVMVILFVGRGTKGKCATFKISGATLVAATELARPGVPLVLLSRQFWPYWLERLAFIN